MVLSEAVRILKESEELKEKLSNFENGTSLLTDRSIWIEQQKLQQLYQKILVMDLDYALEKKVEQDLWILGFKQQIESLQAVAKDKKNHQRSEGQAMLSMVLQAAAGFYLALLHEICSTYKLDLPFRRRISLLGCIEEWSGESARHSAPPAARYISQHCLVHLGDLARYRNEMNVAHTFYRHAVLVSPSSGQPYNQLALIAWRRGRRLDALYWHVRSLLVSAPFPPAPVNLARTLAAAATSALPSQELSYGKEFSSATNAYIHEMFRFYHSLISLDELDEARIIADKLTNIVGLYLADELLDPITHVKMACISIWSVYHTHQVACDDNKSEDLMEASRAARLAIRILSMQLQMLLLEGDPFRHYPAIKVYLEYIKYDPEILRNSLFGERLDLWAALARELNRCILETSEFSYEQYKSTPLPEDEELHGFLPLDDLMKPLDFNCTPFRSGKEKTMTSQTLHSIRCKRILSLGKWLAEHSHINKLDLIISWEEDGKLQFKSKKPESDLPDLPSKVIQMDLNEDEDEQNESKGKVPVIISVADFKEKFREKPVGILKPQGSLERSREERTSVDDIRDDLQAIQKVESLKQAGIENRRKMRMNVAMAAILRKQDENNKQVKFAASPTDNLEAAESPKEEEKTRPTQEKPIKIESERKTGGILSLKDKSAGYPHLVKTESDEKEAEKKKTAIPKVTSAPQMHKQSQNTVKHQQLNETMKRTENSFPRSNYIADLKVEYQPQNISHISAAYMNNPMNPIAANIRLPVVNPKEIDVRTAALRKTPQPEMYSPNKIMPNWQMSNDKKMFMNDLPPRFANQYNRNNINNWNPENQSESFHQNKFISMPPSNTDWRYPNQQQNTADWWKYQTNFEQPFVPNVQSNIYTTPPPNSIANPYRSGAPYQQYQQLNNTFYRPKMYSETESHVSNQPPVHNVIEPNYYTTPLNIYRPTFETTTYPQFGNHLQNKNDAGSSFNMHRNRPPESGLASENDFIGDQSHRRTSELMVGVLANNNLNLMQNLELPEGRSYSLFSGSRENAPHFQPTSDSLWSGPGPSPLERLLEQQKQMKQDPH